MKIMFVGWFHTNPSKKDLTSYPVKQISYHIIRLTHTYFLEKLIGFIYNHQKFSLVVERSLVEFCWRNTMVTIFVIVVNKKCIPRNCEQRIFVEYYWRNIMVSIFLIVVNKNVLREILNKGYHQVTITENIKCLFPKSKLSLCKQFVNPSN